jgi:hypothetical protein
VNNGEAAAHADFIGGATQEISDIVSGWYSTVLGRPADGGGLSYWMGQVVSTGFTQAHAAFLVQAQIEINNRH